MRAATALALLFFLGTFVPLQPLPPPPPVETAELRFLPVALDRSDPARRTLGPLRYLGGWSLESDNRRFGGLSSMHVAGGEMIAVSDAGTLFRFPLPAGEDRVPIQLRTLLEGPGPLRDKTARDVEALLVEDGRAWAAFENRNAVWRYDLPGWTATAAARPRAMRHWPFNRGAEAIARLADGRVLIFSEGAERSDGSTELLLFDGDPAEPGTAVVTLGYRAPAGFRPTDAARLPDGRLLVLNRRFSWLGGLSAKLVLLHLPELGEGVVLEGEEIAHFSRPVVADNLEALSVTREAGKTVVWIASDDNFNRLQRTLLLKFALDL